MSLTATDSFAHHLQAAWPPGYLNAVLGCAVLLLLASGVGAYLGHKQGAETMDEAAPAARHEGCVSARPALSLNA